MRSIRSYEAGSSIMGATVPQRCIRCSAMSTGRWWHGPCGSTNALLVTGHGQVSSSRPSQRRPRVSSRTGGKGLSARSPDGSRVRRESHARFCERPEVKSLRPTHHRLHWRLDVVMNEDQDRSRLGNGPNNLAVLRHMALNVMQKDPTKGSLRGKFKRAGWDDAYLSTLIALF